MPSLNTKTQNTAQAQIIGQEANSPQVWSWKDIASLMYGIKAELNDKLSNQQDQIDHLRAQLATATNATSPPTPSNDKRVKEFANCLAESGSEAIIAGAYVSNDQIEVYRQTSIFSVYSRAGQQAILSYKMEASIWDASMLIGSPKLGTGVSSALLLCLIFNLVLVAMFVAVIGTVIVEPQFDETRIAEFKFWRATIAHDVSLRNPMTGESLASGVCNKKESTPFSNALILSLTELDTYLTGFGWGSVCTGGVMCALSMSIWLMTLIQEARNVFAVMVACLSLPTKSGCGIEEVGECFRLAGASACKKALIFGLSSLRAGIVTLLAWYGVLFLVYEPSVTEMLLNAFSLGLVLNIDELIFWSLAPKVTHTLVARMLPLPLHRYAPVRESVVLPLLIIVPAALVVVYLVRPNIKLIRDSREALCGGVGSSLDFVVAVDAIGIPWAAPTPTSNSGMSSFAAHAVLQAKEHGFQAITLQSKKRANMGSFMQAPTGDALQAFKLSLSEFRQPKDWKIVDVTQFVHVVGWNEIELLAPDARDFGDQNGTVYNQYLRYLLGTPATENATCARVPVARCSMLGRTMNAVVMRQLCPSRCGCDEPTRGTVGSFETMGLEFSVSGCAPWNLRKLKFNNALAALPCEDTISRTTFALWALGFGDTLLMGQNSSLQARIVASFDKGGCPEAVKMIGTESRICEETSIPSICPESCGCNTSLPSNHYHARSHDFCPHACGRTTKLCFTGHVRNYSSVSQRGPFVGYACVFPFKYEGLEYTNCTLADWDVPWCAVTTVNNGVTFYWGDCAHNC